MEKKNIRKALFVLSLRISTRVFRGLIYDRRLPGNIILYYFSKEAWKETIVVSPIESLNFFNLPVLIFTTFDVINFVHECCCFFHSRWHSEGVQAKRQGLRVLPRVGERRAAQRHTAKEQEDQEAANRVRLLQEQRRGGVLLHRAHPQGQGWESAVPDFEVFLSRYKHFI